MAKEPYYISTAIAYASRKPHVGNNYEIVFTDSIARLKRMEGYDVYFLTGTDEHGQKIEELAKTEGISPQEHVDKVYKEVKATADLLGASYTKFIRTTDAQHEKVVQKIFKKLYEQGDIYKSVYEGWYCEPDESFWTDTQVVDGKCPECGRPVQKANEEAYFFRISKYQQQLEDYIETHPTFIFPESRKKEMLNNFIKPGLQDLCVSRSTFKWGIPVPFDEEHIIYVWIDALANYITAIGYDPDGSSDLYKKFWPANAQVIGKDILRFHTIYWPILLMALGQPLPKSIFGHPWMLSGDDKMSKSIGNVIYADEMVDIIGVDGVRYYLLAEMPFAQDGSITHERLLEKYNADLANTLGNLVNRTVAMAQKYFGGQLPSKRQDEAIDKEVAKEALQAKDTMLVRMEEFRCAEAVAAVMNLARRANKYIDETEPWILGKDENQKARLASVLYHLLESIRFLGVLLTPYLPTTAENIFKQIGCAPENQTLESIEEFGQIQASKLSNPEPLFARIDVAETLKKLQQKSKKEEGIITSQEEINYEKFMETQLIVGKILRAEKVEKTDKLLQLTVFDGTKNRTIVSGIALWYTIEDLIGKKIIIVANLKPTKLRGVLSEGMLLAADGKNGEAQVIFLPDDAVEGNRVR